MTPSFQPIDQESRDRAVSTHEALITVEAGAGTGKTSLLTEKYVQLIQQEKARTFQIVAVTFTEKAAGELKERIRRRLKELTLTSAVEELDRAMITTLHAFAASLLRERPLEAEIEPNFRQLDAVASELLLQRLYQSWLPDALASHQPLVERALSSGWTLEKIRELAFELYAHRDLYPLLPQAPEPSDFPKFVKHLIEEAAALYQLAEKECLNTSDQGYQAIERLYRATQVIKGASPGLQERAFLSRVSPAAKGNQKNWSDPSICVAQKERMKELKAQVEEIAAQIRQHLFSDLIAWLGSFLAFAEEQKRNEGKLDFDDLLFLTRDLLRNHPEVRKYFQERYRYFLVDEFQDTDPVQAEMVWLLCSQENSRDAWEDLSLLPGSLFVVGDPKQSIYRFRRADIDMYRRATEKLQAQGERLVIRQNFRSSPPLVNWINATFAPILGETYERLQADSRHFSSPQHKPVFLLEPPQLPQEISARENRLLEAESISAFLQKIMKEKTLLIPDSSGNAPRAVTPADIAILFPTTTDIDVYEETLRRYDLPFALEGGHLFYGRAEIHGLLATLEAIDRPTDAIAVIGALRSAIFGLSDQDLLTLFAHEQPFDYRGINLRPLEEPIRSAIRILRTLHQQREDLSPSQMIFAVLEMTAAIPITLTRRHGEQAAANLEKLLAMAFVLEREEGMTLSRFVQWARERKNERDQQAESPLSTGELDYIRLLTIHKAKGLEFPIVVLANLGSGAGRGENVIADRLHHQFALRVSAGGKRFETSNFLQVEEGEKEKRALEQRRLLYVAATRARDYLVMPKFLGSRRSLYWTLLEEGWKPGASLVTAVPFESLPLREDKDSSTEKPAKSVSTRNLGREEELLQAEIKERSQNLQIGLSLRTASALAHIQAPSPSKEGKSTVASGQAMAIGSALHQVLEQVEFSSPESLTSLAKSACLDIGAPNLTNTVEKLARSALDQPLFARVQKAKRIFREFPFSWKGREGKKEVLYEGSIDLMFEEKDGLVIVDYKTDNLQPDQVTQRSETYAPQLALYAQAIEAITKQHVKERLLFYVRLGEVVTLSTG